MRESLSALLGGTIDYAGLFPPCQLDMQGMLSERARLEQSPNDWILGRTIIPLAKLDTALSCPKIHGCRMPLAVSLIVTAQDLAKGDCAEQALNAEDTGHIRVDAIEFKVPDGEMAVGIVKQVRRLRSELGDVDAYAESAWGENMVATLHECISADDTVGFKARTGGTEAGAFPSAADLALFIHEVASLEAPIKFTAGLHEPVRYEDPELGVMRHGFLNVVCASLGAFAMDWSLREVEAMLSATGDLGLRFEESRLVSAPFCLDAGIGDIRGFRTMFGGFGSCSVEEPVAGLRRLGILEGAGT